MYPVTCRHCGSKIKRGRSTCLRCGEPLVPAATPDEIAATRGRWIGPALAGGTALSVLLLVVTVVGLMPPAQAPVATAPAPSAGQVRRAADSSEPVFLDASRAGELAFKSGNYAEGIDRYLDAIHKHPNDYQSLNNLGQLLERTGKAAEAIPYFERAIEVHPSAWAPHFNLAHAHSRLGHWEPAIVEYRRASALFPDDYAIHYNLGMALHKADQEAAAVAEFQQAVALAPGEPSFQLSLGISLERLNRPLEAAAAYEEYLEMAPAAPESERLRTRINLLRGSADTAR